ncbi:YegP family protein [Lysobacter sp. TAB13]|uniref:YegP family protein n=1 Tax=Lysobacter sp. TAB13 TaxID=3233065 RepID=UPI003F9ADD35
MRTAAKAALMLRRKCRFALKAGNRESTLTSEFHNAKASAQDGIEHAPPASGGRTPADAEELLQQVAAARLAGRLPLALECCHARRRNGRGNPKSRWSPSRPTAIAANATPANGG